MSGHISVMPAEALEQLNPRAGGVYLDGTFGGGGYSAAILEHADCTVWAIDRDPAAIARGASLAARHPGHLHLLQGCFGDMLALLTDAGVTTLDGVVLDLGVSSYQIDDPARGFSFRLDGPLDMRMDPDSGESVADWLAHAEQHEIERCLRDYGEERHARRIARRLCDMRMREPLRTTAQLAAVIAGAVPRSGERIHPATRSFQALRIQINDELGELERALPVLRDALAPAGRLCAIAFHSLEDRIVKRYFRDSARAPEFGQAPGPRFALVTRKPIYPAEAECAANPRARSARLRVLERAA